MKKFSAVTAILLIVMKHVLDELLYLNIQYLTLIFSYAFSI